MSTALCPRRVGGAATRPAPAQNAARMRGPTPRAVEVASSSTSTTTPYYTSADVAPPAGANQSHFLHIDDWPRERLDAVLATAATVKAKLAARDESYKPFAGRTMSMIFTKPSMRTRISFETVKGGGEWGEGLGGRGGESAGWSHPPTPIRCREKTPTPSDAALASPATSIIFSIPSPFFLPSPGLLPLGRPRHLPRPRHHPARPAGGHKGHRPGDLPVQRPHHGPPVCAF